MAIAVAPLLTLLASGSTCADLPQGTFAAIDAGQREVAIAEHRMEKWIAEVRRTPEEMFDKMIENFQSGYAARMGVGEQ